MKKNNDYSIFLGILTLVFLITAVLVSFRMVSESKAFIENKYRYSEILNLENRLLNPAAWMSNQGLDPEMKASAQKALNQAESHYQSAVRYGWLLTLFVLVFGVAILLSSLRKPYFKKAVAFGLVIISISFLGVGVATPILEVSAFHENLRIPLVLTADSFPGMPIVKTMMPNLKIDLSTTIEGRMYYYYQCKSIMDVIALLWNARNYIVSAAIFLFSFAIPLFKLVFSLSFLTFQFMAKRKTLVHFVGKIGKWSMADVFVASAFLAYLSFHNMNVGIDTETQMLLGLCFFFSYVMGSLLSSLFIEWALKPSPAPAGG
jgi:hypothetical protein